MRGRLPGVLDLTSEEHAVLLPVKIVPGSRRTRYLGAWAGRARISVAAPPEKGKANKAVIAFLADLLSVRRREIAIVAGRSTPLKTVRIEQVTEEAVRTALQLDQ